MSKYLLVLAVFAFAAIGALENSITPVMNHFERADNLQKDSRYDLQHAL